MDLTLNTECQTLKSRKVARFATSIEENSNVCNWHLWSIRLYLATGRIKYIGTVLTLKQLIKKSNNILSEIIGLIDKNQVDAY